MRRQVVSLGLAALITAAALWFVLTPQAIAETRRALGNADWRALAAAMAISGSVQYLRAWRFSVLRTGTSALPEYRLIRIAFQLNFFNFILPFRVGELSYPLLMRRAYGDAVLRAAGLLLLARLIDLCVVTAMMLLAAAGLNIGGGAAGNAALAIAGLVIGLLPLGALAAGRRALPERVPVLGSVAARLRAVLADLDRRSAWLPCFLLSIAIWLAFAGAAVLAARAVVAGFPPLTALLGGSAGNIAFALPINGIAGLGPAQAAWVAAVEQAGIARQDAVATCFALYLVVLFSAVLFGAAAMVGRPGAAPQGLKRAATDGVEQTRKQGTTRPA